MCFHAFSGKGYDERFIKNMTDIRELLLSNPDVQLEIIAELDSVCQACPHLRDTGCSKGDDQFEELKIKEMDRKVLSLSGLREGETVKARDAFDAVEKAITPAILTKLCTNCEWLHNGNCLTKISIPFF